MYGLLQLFWKLFLLFWTKVGQSGGSLDSGDLLKNYVENVEMTEIDEKEKFEAVMLMRVIVWVIIEVIFKYCFRD